MDILLIPTYVRLGLAIAFFTGTIRSVLNFQLMSYRWKKAHWSLWTTYFLLNLSFNILMALSLMIIEVQHSTLTIALLNLNINWLFLLPSASHTLMLAIRLKNKRKIDSNMIFLALRALLMLSLVPVIGNHIWSTTQFNTLFIIFTISWVIAGYFYLYQTKRYLSTHFTDYTKVKAFELFPHGLIVTDANIRVLSMNPSAVSILHSIDVSDEKEVRKILDSMDGLYHEGSDTYRINRFPMAEFSNSFIVWELVKVTQLIEIQTDIIQSTASIKGAWDIVKDILIQLKQSVHEEERTRLQQYLHDVMGETFSVINFSTQLLLNQTMTKEDRTRLTDMLDQMYVKLEDRTTGGNDNSFKTLQRSFKRIGMNVIYEGSYPDSYHYRHVTYQILREAISNALKHGGATEVKLSMESDENWYHFVIQNNGKLTSHPNDHGLGLLGMQRLVKDWQGEIIIDSDQHYQVEVRLPNKEKKSQLALE